MSELELRVSWTSMSTWNTCEYKWYLKYILKLVPTAYSAALSKGRFVHLLMQNHFDYQLEFPDSSVDDRLYAHKGATRTLAGEADPFEITDLSIAAYVVTLFIRDYQPNEEADYLTIASEITLEEKLSTDRSNVFTLIGIIDRIVHNIRNNKNYLGEFKTHQARPWKQAEIEMDGQQLLYLELARLMGWNVEDILYLFINTHDYKKKEQYPYNKFFDRDLVFDKPLARKGFKKELFAFVDRVYDATEREQTPRRNLGRHCGRCAFQSYCYMRLKGGSHQAGLSTGFAVKEEKPKGLEEEVIDE